MGGYLSFINPSGPIDWFFIGVFTFLYLVAIGCALFARKVRTERAAELGDSASWDEVESALYTGYDALVERLPGIFITIGLLGTFLGLGLAVTEAAKALASSSLSPDKLFGEVLQPIGFKFRVSVWGIFFSLLCRFFPGMPLGRERRSYARLKWNELRTKAAEREKAAKTQQSSRESRALDVTRQAILKGLKDLSSEIATFFQPVLDNADVKREALQAYNFLASAMERAGRDVQSATDRLSVTSADITKSTSAMTAAVEQVSGSAVKMKESVTSIRQGLREESEHVSARFGESVEALGPVVARHVTSEIERLMDGTVNAVDNVGVSLGQTVRSAFDDNWSGLSDRVTRGFAGLTKKLDGDVREIATNIGAELETTRSAVEHSTKGIQEMLAGIGSNAGRAFEEITRSSLSPVEELLRSMAEAQTGTQDRLRALTLASNQLVKAATVYESSAQKALSDTSSATAKAIETSEAVHQNLLDEAAAFRRALETHGGTLQVHAETTHSQTDRLDALVRSLQGMDRYATALGAASDSAKAQTGRFDSVARALEGLPAHADALRTMSDTTRAQSERIDALVHTLGALVRALPARLPPPTAAAPATSTMAVHPDTSPREPAPVVKTVDGPSIAPPSLAERMRLARERGPSAPKAPPTTDA